MLSPDLQRIKHIRNYCIAIGAEHAAFISGAQFAMDVSYAFFEHTCEICRFCQQVGVDKMVEMEYTDYSGRVCPAVEARALLGSACGGSNRVVWSPSSN